MAAGTDTSFKVRNTLVVNTGFSANSTGIYFGASPILALNSSFYAGQSAFVNTAGNFNISGNVTLNAALVADSSSGDLGQVLTSANTYTYWSTLAASAFTDTTNASLISAGTLAIARLPANAVTNAQLSSNLANYTTSTQLTNNLANYQTSAGLTSNVATLTANNSTNFNGQAASYYTNGSNISTGTVDAARLPANLLTANVADQAITGGAVVTALSLSAGNITVDCGARPLQYIASNSNFTITAPANDGTCVLLLNNGTAANTVTFSGFSVGTNTGDALTKTSGNKFMVFIIRINGVSTYSIKALQ